MKEDKLLKSKTSILYIYRNKETGEFVDEDGNPTDDIFDAVGYPLYSEALKSLETFDEPEEWYIVTKIITMQVIGEPIEVKQFI